MQMLSRKLVEEKIIKLLELLSQSKLHKLSVLFIWWSSDESSLMII